MKESILSDREIFEQDNYNAWRITPLEQAEYLEMSELDRAMHLVEGAYIAGSTHNAQPWGYRISRDGRKIEVLLDISRVLPASDVKGRQSVVSVGWALGNMMLSAKYLGQELSVEHVDVENNEVLPRSADENERYISLARVQMGEIGTQDLGLESIYRGIFTRRVDRKKYNPRSDFREEFYDNVQALDGDGVETHVFRRGDSRIVMIAELQSQADAFVANNAKFARELGDWMVETETKGGLGMPGSTFNITREQEREIIAGFKGEMEIKASNLAGFSRAGRDGISSAACVGMVMIRNQGVRDWMEAGMRLGMIANMIEAEGGSMAVHAGLAEVALVQMGLGALALSGAKPVVLFRAGMPIEGERSPHSPRLPIEEVIVT